MSRKRFAPKQLKVGEKIYQVWERNFNVSWKEKGQKLDMAGWCEPSFNIICINNKYPEDHKQEVSFHEMLHAAFDAAGLKNFSVEEKIIRGLTPILLNILSSNPEWIEYWRKDFSGE